MSDSPKEEMLGLISKAYARGAFGNPEGVDDLAGRARDLNEQIETGGIVRAALYRGGGQELSNALVEATDFHEALVKIRDGSCDCPEFEQREDLSRHGESCLRRIAHDALEA